MSKAIIKIFQRNNWLWLVTAFAVFTFFSQTFLFTWKTAAPYCRADDWRFIDIYLIPFFNGSFKLSDLWSDPVHPTPLYALLFTASAKYSSLQILLISIEKYTSISIQKYTIFIK